MFLGAKKDEENMMGGLTRSNEMHLIDTILRILNAMMSS